MTLVTMSSVRKLSHLLPHPIFIEQLKKVNKSNSLPIIRDAYAEFNLKFDATKERYAGL